MSPAERAAYDAERPIYDACVRTEKALVTLKALRRLTRDALPLATAEAAMRGIEDEITAIGARLTAALNLQTDNIERLQTLTEVAQP